MMVLLTPLQIVSIDISKESKQNCNYLVGDDPDTKKISYKELHQNVCKAANGLKSLGIQKGDRVTIYLTMIPSWHICWLVQE